MMNPRMLKTALRVRPPLMNEDFSVDVAPTNGPPHVYIGHSSIPCQVDFAFPACASQPEIFETTVKPMLQKVITAEGDVSIICCGHVRSGKSFTLFGAQCPLTDSSITFGIYQRIATYIFSLFVNGCSEDGEPLTYFEVAFYNISAHGVIDLMTGSEIALRPGESAEETPQLTYSRCLNAPQMISLLTLALQARPLIRSHTVVNIVLVQHTEYDEGEEPEEGEEYKRVTSSITLYDIGNRLMPISTAMCDNVWVKEDILTLEALLLEYSGTSENVQVVNSPLSNSLKRAFNGERDSLIFCCLSPSLLFCNFTMEYIRLITKITEIRNLNLSEELMREEMLREEHLNFQLLSEAESLLSNDSTTSKKECEDESLKSHTHLECIEEVTESEEEIGSEKMSQSPTSLSESDREESEVKACQISNNNFFSNLVNMCVEFYDFVDKFVDNFKAKITLSPVKERKSNYSAVRRGGLSQSLLPPMECPVSSETNTTITSTAAKTPVKFAEQEIALNGKMSCQKKPCQQQQSAEQEKMGCRKKSYQQNASSLEENREKRQSGKIRKHKEDLSNSSFTTDNQMQKSVDNKESTTPNSNQQGATLPMVKDESGHAITVISTLQSVYKWFLEEEKSLVELKGNWETCISRCATAAPTDKALVSTVDKERTTAMIHGIEAFVNAIKMMNGILKADMEGSMHDYMGLKHTIRQYRQQRKGFEMLKNHLEKKVKNKTASNEEVSEHLLADELIDATDSCIELLNFMMANNRCMEPKIPKTNSIWNDMNRLIEGLSIYETKHLLRKYVLKVIDLRDNSKEMETSIAELESKTEWATNKMQTMQKTITSMRNDLEKLTKELEKHKGNQVEESCEELGAQSLLALEGEKRKRVSGVPKMSSIPQQNLSKLQVSKPPPPGPRVTFTHNKLIIQKYNLPQ